MKLLEPDGFDWGCKCGGTSQLALAILLQAGVQQKIALARYKEFAATILVPLPMDANFDRIDMIIMKDGTWKLLDPESKEAAMRIDGRANTRRVWVDGRELCPKWSQAVRSHSPDGFNWGYPGSGTAQLALALMLHAGVPKVIALARYQAFKEAVLVPLAMDKDFDIEVVIRADGTWK